VILVHRRYTHHYVVIPITSLENTTIHIHLNISIFRLVTIYKRPSNILLPNDFTALLDSPYNTIIAGDPKSKHQLWFSIPPNAAGNMFAHFINSRNDLTIAAPNTSTHYPNNSNHSPDILDIAIIKTNNIQYQIENFSSHLSSDHTPVVLELHSTSVTMKSSEPIHSVDWTIFQSFMDSVSHFPSSGSTISSIDLAIKNLTTHISNDIAQNTSSIMHFDTLGRILPKKLQYKIDLKHRLRSRWQRTRHLDLKMIMNRQIAKVKDLMAEYRNNQWNNLLGSQNEGTNAWKRFYRLN
jgi:hypothetical protein